MNQDPNSQLKKLHEVEQSLHTHVVQKQSYHTQLNEVEHALKELDNEKESYRIIGSIMVKTSPEKLKSELEKRKETLGARIKSIQNQERNLQEEMQKMQQQLLGDKDGTDNRN